MKKRRYGSCLALFFICSWLGGCASFPNWQLQELETLPPAPERTLKAKLSLSWNHYFNGNPRTEFDEKGYDIGKDVALETFQKSGYFSKVDMEMTDPDLNINLQFQNQEAGSFVLAFISGFTFCVIPAAAANTFVMDAEVTHLKTGEIRKYHLEDTVDTYFQILLIFIMPFNWPGSVAEDVLENMHNQLIVKMQEDGLLNKAQNRSTEIEIASF